MVVGNTLVSLVLLDPVVELGRMKQGLQKTVAITQEAGFIRHALLGASAHPSLLGFDSGGLQSVSF